MRDLIYVTSSITVLQAVLWKVSNRNYKS